MVKRRNKPKKSSTFSRTMEGLFLDKKYEEKETQGKVRDERN